MQGDFKSPVAVYPTTISKSVQRNITDFKKKKQTNITDFFKAWITTDSIKIFSVTFCTVVTVYCTCKISKDAFRIVVYVTTFYLQHCAVARFVLKQ